MSGRWALAPVVALRQTGFPFELIGILAAPDLTTALDGLVAAEAAARAAAQEVRSLFRAARPANPGAGGVLGYLLPFPEPVRDEIAARLAPADAVTLDRYQRLATGLAEGWQAYGQRFADELAGARRRLVTAFGGDDLLREVLMLSNDAQYPQYERWLRQEHADLRDKHGRSMTDLLARYLQRVTTKNETHSHFGPVTAGRFVAGPAGIGWDVGPAERVAFFSYWAAGRLAALVSRDAVRAESVLPRRRPWAFRRDGRVALYAFTTETGFAADWRFVRQGEEPIDAAGAWLFDRCDGARTVASLRADYAGAVEHGDVPSDRPFDDVLGDLTAAGWVVSRFEIPIGEPYPLRALRTQLPAGDPARELIEGFESRLDQFARGDAAERPVVLAGMKAEFEAATGEPANRGGGLHYADRAVFFEECHARVRDLTLGPDLARFVREDLAVVYELAVTGPKWRLWRENQILAAWLGKRFGDGEAVPLDLFYAAYFDDHDALLSACDEVDAELDRLDRDLTGMLLGGPVTVHEGRMTAEVSPARVAAVLAAYAAPVPAVCNPDVMIAARDAAAVGRGEFTAVIGDCHALREVLTHTSFTPLIAERVPELAAAVVAEYRKLLDPDEVLCDMARSHPNKTGSQVVYPGPDVEIFGRSPKPRSEVVQPDRMYLVARDGRAELRAHGVAGRLRLTAPPAGGPSIRQDPLSPFSFPRHFGGVGLRADDVVHLPRLVCGRVVLHRETWRVPATDLRGRTTGGRDGSGDAAEFFAAHRLRARLRLPRYVFAKVAGEPKPVFVDFSAPLLVRQLARMARASGGTVTISEMLPGPEDLWLAVDGARYTSELRCALFSPPALPSSTVPPPALPPPTVPPPA